LTTRSSSRNESRSAKRKVRLKSRYKTPTQRLLSLILPIGSLIMKLHNLVDYTKRKIEPSQV